MTTEPEKIKAAIDTSVIMLRHFMPRLDEFCMLTARMQKAQFSAYIEEGFTPDQALYLVKSGASK